MLQSQIHFGGRYIFHHSAQNGDDLKIVFSINATEVSTMNFPLFCIYKVMQTSEIKKEGPL